MNYDFELDGFSTQSARLLHPIVVNIWRTGCGTCRYTMPFLQRLAESYPEIAVIGVSQDDKQTTDEWCRGNGITFTQVQDTNLGLSRRFGLRSVPYIYCLDASGSVLTEVNAWSKDAVEGISEQLAKHLGIDRRILFSSGETVVSFKPG